MILSLVSLKTWIGPVDLATFASLPHNISGDVGTDLHLRQTKMYIKLFEVSKRNTKMDYRLMAQETALGILTSMSTCKACSPYGNIVHKSEPSGKKR
jgi:hypothetical protein